MIKVRVNQQVLGSDGTNPSVMTPAGSVADLNDNHARYLVGMNGGSYVTPINLVAPTLDAATVANGGTVNCNSNGTWAGDPTINFTYQWYAGNTALAGKTTAALATVAGDVGKTVRCRVTGTNGVGNTFADSAPCIVT